MLLSSELTFPKAPANGKGDLLISKYQEVINPVASYGRIFASSVFWQCVPSSEGIDGVSHGRS